MTDQAEKKHSAFWGVMVIAGTVIGGGMFALPVDLAGAWFFWGAFILIIAWFSMLHSGLLLLEAHYQRYYRCLRSLYPHLCLYLC